MDGYGVVNSSVSFLGEQRGVIPRFPSDSNRMGGEFHAERSGDLEDGLKAGLGTGGQRGVAQTLL